MAKNTGTSISPCKVLVSIINYRTAELTIQCAQSVLDDLDGIEGQLVIVDNKSDDGSAEKIEQWITTRPLTDCISLVRSEKNSGFSGGHNQGISERPADYILVLNSDTVVRSGFFKEILQAADNMQEFGLLAPRIDYEDGTQQVSCFRFPSLASEFLRGAQSGPVSRLFSGRQVALKNPPSQDQIDWASFACILLRSSMLKQVGLMDEGYFLYFEDIEYCWRARQAGWRIAYVPQARVVHFRGGSGPVKSLTRQHKRLPPYYYASRTRFFRQSRGACGPLLANLAWVMGRIIARLRILAGKGIPPSKECEARDMWTNFLSPLGDSRSTGS